MSFQKTPGGTRGDTPSWLKGLTRFLGVLMTKQHRRKGDRFMGMDVLYLTTIGAKTGEERQTPLAYFPDGDEAWLVVASSAGSARNPGWYHNIAAHPDQVHVEVGGRLLRVTPEQLEGQRREEAWRRIVASQPRYAGYQQKTDREGYSKRKPRTRVVKLRGRGARPPPGAARSRQHGNAEAGRRPGYAFPYARPAPGKTEPVYPHP